MWGLLFPGALIIYQKYFMMFRNIGKIIPHAYMILAVLILVILNLFNITYLHHYLLLVSIFILFLFVKRKLKYYQCIIWLYIIILAMMLIITLLSGNFDRRIAVEAFFIYAGPPLFWLLYFNKYPNFNVLLFKKFVVYLACVVAILGIIQFFADKTIYGLIPHIDYFDIDFARSFMAAAGSHFRVSSILVSPQIFGLFSALSFCVLISLYKIKSKSFLLLGAPILTASLLSGQRIVILIYLLFFGLKFLYNLRLSFTKAILIFVGVFIGLIITQSAVNHFLASQGMSESRVFDVFSSPQQVIEYEEGVRWSRWRNLILEANPLIGEGIGITNVRTDEGRRFVTSESYFVQLYYEGGLFVFLSFLLIILYSICRLYIKKVQFKEDGTLLIALSASLLAVHAFTNPDFFAFWGIIIYSMHSKLHSPHNKNNLYLK